MKRSKRILSLLLSIVMILGMLPMSALAANGAFSDVKTSDWFYDDVRYVCEKGLMDGTGSNTFNPKATTTRGMIVTILYRLSGEPAGSGVCPFSDVAAGKYYEKAIAWAAENRIVSGYADGTFGPDNAISREQLAAILYRYAVFCGYAVTASAEIGRFADADMVSSYALTAMKWASAEGLINGSGSKLDPQGSATRAQVAAILARFCKNIAGISTPASKPASGTGTVLPPAPNPTPDPDPNPTYTVTFDSNGGSAAASQTVVAGQTATEPEAPTKEGYYFNGWFSDTELTICYDFTAPVTGDITLYAAWEVENKDALIAEYVVKQIIIGYQQGDNANHVTRNIGLPTSLEGIEDVSIVWGSSDVAISPEGIVTRPTGADATVTLTVTATKNEKTCARNYTLTVIHTHDRDVSNIPNKSVIDIKNMNHGGDVDISYNDDKSQVISIDGQYSDIVVNNADDALDVIQSIRTIIGINDPYNELTPLVTNSDEYGAEYTFAQKYNESPVFGRRVTVSVDENGITDSLSSGVYASEKLDGINNTPTISVETAESSVINAYGDNCVISSDKTALSLYTLNECADRPVLAYEVCVSGTNSDGEYINDTVFVNAHTSVIEHTYTNIADASAKTGSGKNEFKQTVSFPVAFTWTDWYFYYMQDLERNIQMYDQKCFIDFRIGSELNWWTDNTAISAYTNMIKTYDWYKNTLRRNSVDGNGLKLKAVVHNDRMRDNAFWDGEDLTLNFCNNSIFSSATRTTAAALDVIAHEYTHGVVQFSTGGLPYENATGAINEGYADIFGCLVDGDWQMGEDWVLIRDAVNPTAHDKPDRMSSPFYIDYTTNSNDHGGVHTNSALVYHAAYLMTEYGMEETTLAKLWYKSLDMGYDGTATFQTLRRNVLKAAKKIHLPKKEIEIIKRAFDAVEIYGARGEIIVTVTDVKGNAVSGAEVAIVGRGIQLARKNNCYNCTLDEGTYSLRVSAEGYVEYNANVKVVEAETNKIDVVLVHDGVGTVNGTIVSSTSARSLAGVTLNLRSGIGMTNGEIIKSSVTDENGKYLFELNAGYYTIEMRLEGYTTSYVDVVINSGEMLTANNSLSPIMTSNSYRVVLTWGEFPYDLDSHLLGTSADGTAFHIYFGNKIARRNDGTEIGNLDVDDTTSYGPETTTFIAETEGSYYFYVYRYSSSGTLPASGATVEVYNGESLIARYTIDPTASSENRYWNVFKIENGIFRTVDLVSSNAVTSHLASNMNRSIFAEQDIAKK